MRPSRSACNNNTAVQSDDIILYLPHFVYLGVRHGVYAINISNFIEILASNVNFNVTMRDEHTLIAA